MTPFSNFAHGCAIKDDFRDFRVHRAHGSPSGIPDPILSKLSISYLDQRTAPRVKNWTTVTVVIFLLDEIKLVPRGQKLRWQGLPLLRPDRLVLQASPCEFGSLLRGHVPHLLHSHSR